MLEGKSHIGTLSGCVFDDSRNTAGAFERPVDRFGDTFQAFIQRHQPQVGARMKIEPIQPQCLTTRHLVEKSLAEIAAEQLAGVIGVEPDKPEPRDTARAARIRFKSTAVFLERLNDFIAAMPDTVFCPTEYRYGGFTATNSGIACPGMRFTGKTEGDLTVVQIQYL